MSTYITLKFWDGKNILSSKITCIFCYSTAILRNKGKLKFFLYQFFLFKNCNEYLKINLGLRF